MTWNTARYDQGTRDAYEEQDSGNGEALHKAGLANDGADEYALGFGHGVAQRLRNMGLTVAAAEVLVQTNTFLYPGVSRLINKELARWSVDPDHEGVVALVLLEDPDVAILLVYVDDDDLETSATLERMLAEVRS